MSGDIREVGAGKVERMILSCSKDTSCYHTALGKDVRCYRISLVGQSGTFSIPGFHVQATTKVRSTVIHTVTGTSATLSNNIVQYW